ncbi:MAG TPA: PilN domain-containing protein [Thermoanaerobaculia bacterium]|nr:PilN domain-containing protein [Thermoanaerobaculia bacterium]
MRPLHPNLASRPYRDYRPVWAVAIALGLATVVLLAYNLQTAYRYFATTRETRDEIARVEEQVAAERASAASARETASQFDTAELRARASFINARIAERAFSWSQLLDDLERVFPDEVRLRRLSPTSDPSGATIITMECLARSEDGMVGLLNNMLASPKFARPFPSSESVAEGGLVRFTLSAEYRPSPRGVVE